MIRILKTNTWAVPKQPAAPHIHVEKGEERDDLPDTLVARMIEVGQAEEVEGAKPKKETASTEDERPAKKPAKKRWGADNKVKTGKETKVVEAAETKGE